MKRLLLSLLLLVPVSAVSQQENLVERIQLSCEILDQIILGVENGKANRYGNAKGYPSKGETIFFNINYQITPTLDNFYKINIKHNLSMGDTELFVSPINFKKKSEDVRDLFKASYGELFFHYENVVKIMVSSNTINYSLAGTEISLNRYYMNDWQLKLTSDNVLTSQITIANCMNMPDEYNKMLEQIEQFNLKFVK